MTLFFFCVILYMLDHSMFYKLDDFDAVVIFMPNTFPHYKSKKERYSISKMLPRVESDVGSGLKFSGETKSCVWHLLNSLGHKNKDTIINICNLISKMNDTEQTLRSKKVYINKNLSILKKETIQNEITKNFNDFRLETRQSDSESSEMYQPKYNVDVNDLTYNSKMELSDDENVKSQEQNEEYGPIAQGNDKIVGGFDVEIKSYPYHVGYGTNCAGAIIDQYWVVTAAHCGYKAFVFVGSNLKAQGKSIPVDKTFVHPLWSSLRKEHAFDYDFQLLRLSKPLEFGEKIQPIKVAHIEDMVVGKIVTVTGWGNIRESGPYSAVLRAVNVPIIPKATCQTVQFPFFKGSLTPRMFCAGYKEGRKDACQGDSGGPAVSYDRLIGVVSFGYGCATPNSYGVYSKVAYVRRWIEDTTGLILT